MNQSQFKRAANISTVLAVRWYNLIEAAMQEFGITTPQDQAMFIAQAGHESGSFQRLVESLNYTPDALLATFGKRITRQQADALGRTADHPARQDAIANLVYGGRMGNKDAGDGWKYRGRGLIQITGLDNYLACSSGLKVDLVVAPERLEQDTEAARSAAWFYTSNGCLQHPGDVRTITRIINGGTNGLIDRVARYNTALKVLAL